MKKLNWTGFLIVLVLCMIGALTNKNINSVLEYTILVAVIGIPFGAFFLFEGKKS